MQSEMLILPDKNTRIPTCSVDAVETVGDNAAFT